MFRGRGVWGRARSARGEPTGRGGEGSWADGAGLLRPAGPRDQPPDSRLSSRLPGPGNSSARPKNASRFIQFQYPSGFLSSLRQSPSSLPEKSQATTVCDPIATPLEAADVGPLAGKPRDSEFRGDPACLPLHARSLLAGPRVRCQLSGQASAGKPRGARKPTCRPTPARHAALSLSALCVLPRPFFNRSPRTISTADRAAPRPAGSGRRASAELPAGLQAETQVPAPPVGTLPNLL